MSNLRLDIDGTGRSASRRRALGRLLVLSAVALTLVVLLLPWLLSSGPGNRVLLSVVNGRIAGTAAWTRVQTGWRSGTRVEGFGLVDPEGLVVVRGLDARLPDTGLVGLGVAAWRGDVSGLDLSVRAAEVDLRRGGGGALNLRRAVSGAVASEATGEAVGAHGTSGSDRPAENWRDRIGWTGSGLPRPPAACMSLEVDLLRWRPAPEAEETRVEDLRVRIDARDADAIELSLAADTLSGGEAGRVDAGFTLLAAALPRGGLRLREAGVASRGRLDAVPVAAVAELLGVGPVLAETLGPHASASWDASGTLVSPVLRFEARSGTASASLNLVPDGPGVAAVEGGHLNLRITPAAFAAATVGRGWTLQEETTLHLDLEELRIGEGAGGARPEWATLRAGGDAGAVRLLQGGEAVAFADTRIRIQSGALGRGLGLSLATEVRAPEGVWPVRASAFLANARTPGAAGRPELRLEAEGLPTRLLSLLDPRGTRASKLLGPRLGGVLTAAQVEPRDRLRLRPELITMTAEVESDGLSGPIAVRLGPGGAWGAVSTPEPLRLTVTDAALGEAGLLGRHAILRLDEPLLAELEVRELRWKAAERDESRGDRWDRLRRFEPGATGAAASLRFDRARLRGQRGGVLSLSSFVLDLAADRPGDVPELFLYTEVDAPGDRESGTVQGRVRVSRLLDTGGRFAPEDAEVRGSLAGNTLPAETLDRLLDSGGRVEALLGDVFSPALTLDIERGVAPRLAATFSSVHSVAGLSASREGGDWRIERGGRLQLALTEAGADALRGRLHPLTLDLVRGVAGEPIELVPAAGGVLEPTGGWAGWLGLFEGGTLSPGALQLAGDGWLARAVRDAVRQRAVGLGNALRGDLRLEASPIVLRFREGRLSHGPIWLSSEDLTVGLRGWADPAGQPDDRESSRIEMTLGVPGGVLRGLAPGLPPLPPATVYELPVSGWIDNPLVGVDGFATDLMLASDADAVQPWSGDVLGWELSPEARLRLDALAETTELAVDAASAG